MKNLLLSLSLLLLASGCGAASDADSNALAAPNRKAPVTSERILKPVKGHLASATAKSAPAPAMGLWTEVAVEFEVHCAAKLETASLASMTGADGKTKILASAFVSTEIRDPNQPTCLAFSTHTETLSLPGIVSLDDLELVSLEASDASIPASTIAIDERPDVKVVATRPLCPAGVVCVQGGTIVTLEVVMSSCVNKLATVATAAEQLRAASDLGRIELAVNAIELVDEASRRVRCRPTSEKLDVTLPGMFGDAKSIDLIVLQ